MSQEENPPNHCFLYFLRLLKVFSIIAMLLNITTFVVVIKAVVDSTNLNGLEKAYTTMSMIGYILFTLILIISEFDPPIFMQFFMCFHYWVGRGSGMTWLAIQTLAQSKAFSEVVGNESGIDPGVLDILGTIAGWIIFSVGILYILFGALCLRKCLGDKSGELEISLIKKEDKDLGLTGGAAPVVDSAASAADAMLIANMSLALGMTPDNCRSQFSGKNGGKNAKEFAQKRSEEIGRAAAQGAINVARAQPEAQQAAIVANQASATVANAHAVSQVAAARVNDDDFGVRKPANDDDELERMYYASRTEQSGDIN